MLLFRAKYVSLIFLLLSVKLLSLGQSGNNTIQISWRNPRPVLDSMGRSIMMLDFPKALFRKEVNYLPSIILTVPGEASSFKLTSYTTEELSEEEQKIISNFTLSHTVNITINYPEGKPYSYIYVVPLINGPSGIQKITSFEYSYQSSPVQLRSKAKAVSNNTSNLKIAAANTSSVLSSGNWYKLRISSSGIFKIDYDFLQSMGINPDNIDPREIRIYGNGGGMLPQLVSAFRHDDLTENPIYVAGESDGVFNKGSDYALFYAQGPDTWSYDSSKNRFVHTKNIYSDYTYYFLTVGQGNGLRVLNQPTVTAPLQTITTFDERYFHELESENILQSGREWYGEKFDYQTDYTFNAGSFPGITPNTDLTLTSSVLGRSFYNSSFSLFINGQALGTQSLLPIINDVYVPKGSPSTKDCTINTNLVSGTNISVRYIYNKGFYSSAIGNLNYFELNFKRDLKLYGNQTTFRSIDSKTQSTSEFKIGNSSSDVFIWDITDPVSPQNVSYNLSGSEASFNANTTSLREFVVFKGNDFSSPEYAGYVGNQDLHGIGLADLPDMVIITPSQFLGAASRLANYRSDPTKDNLNVATVNLDQIYNEFSSGAQDITAIRDFMKMLYSRRTATDSVRWLLLMGDDSFDYKDRTTGNTNFIPIYEARETLHPINSYSSDDYYGFLDDFEGEWMEDGSGDDSLDIGIGRLTVKSLTEAEDVVNKIINYSSNADCLGKWRNKLTFLADDGDTNLHLNDANSLATYIENNHKEYNVNKIFLDAYPQISNPGGETSPAVIEALNQDVEKGALVRNYTGHGGDNIWAQEKILVPEQIKAWDNLNQLSLFITATCDFGRTDNPALVSGAEETLLNPHGGSIGIISSARPVFSNFNLDFNTAIYQVFFKKIGGKMPCLGDIIKLAKNSSLVGSINNRNFILIGDPSLRLAYPQESIIITKVNGNIPSTTDTIKALSKVSLEGEVRNEIGSKLNDFNGLVNITVYDKPSQITTLGTQGSPSTTFKLMNNFIYEGTATVANGSFNVSFIVPKDISYQFDKGKISLYAKKNGYSIDGNGYNSDIIIGGSNPNFIPDNNPPVVKLFLNDESFVFGGLTSSNSTFIAKLSDENGINIAGQGIGHEITATIDNGNEVIVLNEFYSAQKDNYKEGKVEYPIKGLTPGPHSIKFKCWDTYNNSSESYLEFIVANDAKISLEHVLNYPNPFSTHTTFHFDHNRAGDDLEVLVQIYSVSGKLIKTLDTRSFFSNSHFSDLIWDGRDDFGDKIGKGVYVYKVNIKSLRDGSHISKFQKLVILN